MLIGSYSEGSRVGACPPGQITFGAAPGRTADINPYPTTQPGGPSSGRQRGGKGGRGGFDPRGAEGREGEGVAAARARHNPHSPIIRPDVCFSVSLQFRDILTWIQLVVPPIVL